MYSLWIENSTEEEAEEFIEELYAPLDPETAKAEQNFNRWLKGG